VGSSPRRTLERLSEDFFDFLIVDTPRSSAARCIGQSLDFLPGIRAAPLANRGQRDSFAPGDLGVSQSLRSAKNDHLGGPGLEELIWATKRFGWVVVYGQLGAMENGTPFPLGACAFRGLKVHASFRVFDFTGPLSWVFQQEPRQLSVRSALFRTAWRRDAFRLRSIGSLSDWANTQRRTATWKRMRGSVRS
jgi:hypothetical protein